MSMGMQVCLITLLQCYQTKTRNRKNTIKFCICGNVSVFQQEFITTAGSNNNNNNTWKFCKCDVYEKVS
ncbi:hypothetical protein T07_10202 [Trichinella nelsoni]|uniref:Uncharacterized protein n=1 Tax=Trichinella nelsoni TaxID=6336 RepID=A0A0V0SLV7_9BILA|nr:hypothetical protein T07_10202 [Trichinella nelsoni]